MSESWDDYAADWDMNEGVILYSEKAFQSLSEQIPLEGKDILDFGCGTGRLTEKLAPIANQIVALDASPKMIEVLDQKQLSNVTTIATILSEGSLQSQPSLHGKFDVIVASSVCAFLPDYEAVLKLLKSLMPPNGIFVQWDWLLKEESSEVGFTLEQVEVALRNTGFSIESLGQVFELESPQGAMPVLMAVAK